MTFCIKIPSKLKFKRFNKKYAKLKYLVDFSRKTTIIQNSPQFICGLKAITHGFLSAKLAHTCILLLRRAVGKGRVGWPRVRITFNLKVPVTKKSEGHRMGKGKGAVRSWGVAVKAGSFVFKIHKSPRKMFFIKSFDWTNIYSFYEWMDTTSAVYDSEFLFQTLYKTSNNLNVDRFGIFFKFNVLLAGFCRILCLDFQKTWFLFTIYFRTIAKKSKNNYIHSFFGSINLIRKHVLHLSRCTNFSFLNYVSIVNILTSLFSFVFYRYLSAAVTYKINYPLFSSRLFKLKRFFIIFAQKSFLFCTKRFVQISYTPRINSSPVAQNRSVFYLDNTLLAEKSQRLPATKISYLPSLYRGLVRIKHKLPFNSEFYFVDERNLGFNLYSNIKNKRKNKLQHLSQK